MKTTFNISWRTEFGGATTSGKVKPQETAEETFREILKAMPKKVLKTWEAVEFTFENEEIRVMKHWLEETNFNFQQSHEIV